MSYYGIALSIDKHINSNIIYKYFVITSWYINYLLLLPLHFRHTTSFSSSPSRDCALYSVSVTATCKRCSYRQRLEHNLNNPIRIQYSQLPNDGNYLFLLYFCSSYSSKLGGKYASSKFYRNFLILHFLSFFPHLSSIFINFHTNFSYFQRFLTFFQFFTFFVIFFFEFSQFFYQIFSFYQFFSHPPSADLYIALHCAHHDPYYVEVQNRSG